MRWNFRGAALGLILITGAGFIERCLGASARGSAHAHVVGAETVEAQAVLWLSSVHRLPSLQNESEVDAGNAMPYAELEDALQALCTGVTHLASGMGGGPLNSRPHVTVGVERSAGCRLTLIYN